MNSYVIDANGDIYKCWSLIGKKEYSVGSLDTGIFINKHYDDVLTKEYNLTCKKCINLPLCRAGCILKTLNCNEFKCPPYIKLLQESIISTYLDYKHITKGGVNDDYNNK